MNAPAVTDQREVCRRDEDKTTHELVIEMFRAQREMAGVLNRHIAAEPQTIANTIDMAIDRLVPDGDAEGHRTYHQSAIDAVEAKRKASIAEEQFWTGLRRDAMKGGILGLGKVALICLGLYLAFRFNYKGPMPW